MKKNKIGVRAGVLIVLAAALAGACASKPSEPTPAPAADLRGLLQD